MLKVVYILCTSRFTILYCFIVQSILVVILFLVDTMILDSILNNNIMEKEYGVGATLKSQ